MPHVVTLANGMDVSDERNRLDWAFIHASLAGTHWAAGRSHALTERCWSHCLCFGVYNATNEQVGFGRVLTDYTFRAHLGDIFIDPAWRRRGLARALVQTMLEHPELRTVTSWTLTTRDGHPVYARFGFRVFAGDGQWMTLLRAAEAVRQIDA